MVDNVLSWWSSHNNKLILSKPMSFRAVILLFLLHCCCCCVQQAPLFFQLSLQYYCIAAAAANYRTQQQCSIPPFNILRKVLFSRYSHLSLSPSSSSCCIYGIIAYVVYIHGFERKTECRTGCSIGTISSGKKHGDDGTVCAVCGVGSTTH